MCKSTKIECPRCGGSGETEFTHVVYGVCFMCKGDGMVYPKRVGELTEKAKIRKANKDAKRQAEQEAIDLIKKEEADKYHAWQYDRNFNFLSSDSFFKCGKMISFEEDLEEDLGVNVTKEDVVSFLNKRRFKKLLSSDRTNINKWILQTYGFPFFEIYKDYDLQENSMLNHSYKEM